MWIAIGVSIVSTGMGKVSAAEADYIRKGISEGLRSDGRSASQHRRIMLECDTVQQSNGSASCSIGGTQVIVAVRVSISFHVSVSTACCWDLSVHLYCLSLLLCLGGTQTVVPSIMVVRVSIREWALPFWLPYWEQSQCYISICESQCVALWIYCGGTEIGVGVRLGIKIHSSRESLYISQHQCIVCSCYSVMEVLKLIEWASILRPILDTTYMSNCILVALLGLSQWGMVLGLTSEAIMTEYVCFKAGQGPGEYGFSVSMAH